jgi:hypothetical protein
METNLFPSLLFLGLTLILTLLVNSILLLNIFSARRKASAMQTWPSAPGSIVESELRSRHIYYPHIVYQYNVMGQTYTGKRISPGPESGSSRARELVAKYPPGAPVTVYYDPQNPSDAALERDFSKTMPRLWFSLIAANIMLCLGMALPLLMFVFSNG